MKAFIISYMDSERKSKYMILKGEDREDVICEFETYYPKYKWFKTEEI